MANLFHGHHHTLGHHPTANRAHGHTTSPRHYLSKQEKVDEVHAPSLVVLQPGLAAKAVEGLAPALHHGGGEAVHGGTGPGETPPVSREAVEPR